MCDLKLKIEEIERQMVSMMTDTKMTIPQICNELKIEEKDEYIVMGIIAHSDNIFYHDGYKTIYEPDGCAGYMAEYKCKNGDHA